ncbi:MAG: hypothetical protein RL742_1116 [Bacteroidota bacterium]
MQTISCFRATVAGCFFTIQHVRIMLQTRFLLLPLLLFVACQQGADHPTVRAAAQVGAQPTNEKWLETREIVYQSDDGGANWQDISAGLPPELLVMRILPGKDGEIFLGAQNGVFRYNPPPSVETWSNEFPMYDQVVGVFSGPSGMYVSWVENGFFKNMPGKTAWMPMGSPAEKQYVWSAVETPAGAVVVCNESGIYKTADGGKTWKPVFQEVAPSNLYIENGILFGVCFGGILRSTDDGETWAWILQDKGSYKSLHLLDGRLTALIRKADACTLTFPGDPNAKPNWPDLSAGLSAGLSGIKHINELQQAGNTLFCSHSGGISRSDNRGKTWRLILPAPDENTVLRLAVSKGKIFVVKATGC